MFMRVFCSYVASTALLAPKAFEGTDSVGGQLRRDKEYPLSGVTSFGRVQRKVPESDARSVGFSFRTRQTQAARRHL